MFRWVLSTPLTDANYHINLIILTSLIPQVLNLTIVSIFQQNGKI